MTAAVALAKALNADVEFILTNAPRLMDVATATAISFALWDGVNRALLESDNNTDRREIASGYRGDCAFTVVSRLSLLLDRDPKQVSFQTLYTRLQSDAVVTSLLKRLDENESSTSETAEIASDAIQRFLRTYRSIGWHDLHGRLVHFRNRGVAHLTPQKIEKRVTYAELKTLSSAVAIMGECMEPFARDGIPLQEDEIKEWSDRAFAVWKGVLRGKHG
jgi:hypothetical protein